MRRKDVKTIIAYFYGIPAMWRMLADEQAELEVVSANAPAIALYRKLGFETTGTIPRAFKYQDGSCADFLFMVKNLV